MWSMKRWAPPMLLALLCAAVLLLGWLVLGGRDTVPILATQTPGSLSESSRKVSVAADEEPEIIESDKEVSIDSLDIVSGGSAPHEGIQRGALDGISGPEIVPGVTPIVLLENVRGTVRQYCERFGGNPVGSNREITAMLNGGNNGQVVFLQEEDGMRMNERGQLVDNWGTPFFFHQISATVMEIRSAGPDRKMWSRDDLMIK